jgi:hypothetical protein
MIQFLVLISYLSVQQKHAEADYHLHYQKNHSQMMTFPRTRHKLPVLLDCLFPAILVVYVYKQATWCSIFTELHVLGDVSKDH